TRQAIVEEFEWNLGQPLPKRRGNRAVPLEHEEVRVDAALAQTAHLLDRGLLDTAEHQAVDHDRHPHGTCTAQRVAQSTPSGASGRWTLNPPACSRSSSSVTL